MDQAENKTLTKAHEKFFKSLPLLSLLLCLETNSCLLELKFCWSVSQSAPERSSDISELPVFVFSKKDEWFYLFETLLCATNMPLCTVRLPLLGMEGKWFLVVV